MSYKLKLSSKNQVTIPVALLKDLNLNSTKKTKTSKKGDQDTYLIIVKNLQGKYEIVNPYEILDNLQGSLQAPEHLKNISDEELEEQIKNARITYIKNKYSHDNASH